jgi:hypothetical protein
VIPLEARFVLGGHDLAGYSPDPLAREARAAEDCVSACSLSRAGAVDATKDVGARGVRVQDVPTLWGVGQMQLRQTKVAVAEEQPAAGVAVPPSAAAARRLAEALDGVLDEGITDFAVRTRGDRRRVAALHAGFAAGEALLPRLRSRGRRAAPTVGERTRALLRIARHLLFWAGATGRDDRSAATRAALDALRAAVRAAAGTQSPASDATLMLCEGCGVRGAELDSRSPTPARTRALCAGCAAQARRGGRGSARGD